MKSNKKISLAIIFTTLSLLITYLINKLVFFVASIGEVLYHNNGYYYGWRFGNIFYTKQGNGNPILLIHDLNSTSSAFEWSQVTSELSKNHTVYTIDLLGCGRSDKPKLTYTNFLYVQLISDFIKHVIKQKTDIVTSGDISSAVIMTCHNDDQLINKILLINPQSFSDLKKYPKYRHKIYKWIIELPIIGTTIYNIAFSKNNIKQTLTEKSFYNIYNVRKKIIKAYYEAAHLKGSSSKFLYSSIKSHYTNITITHSLSELNNSIFILNGEHQINRDIIIKDYLDINSSIETAIIKNTKHLPHLEKPEYVLEILDMFFD